MSRRPPSLRFYFSFRSPYSWLAVHLLRRLASTQILKTIEYIPFWEPDLRFARELQVHGKEFLYRPMSRAHHLYILQDVRRLAAEHGLAMRWPVDEANPWWERPHLAYLAAARLGLGDACREALYQARWERGENICATATIESVADKIGVDRQRLVAAPEDPAVRQDALEALESCVDANAFGVPYFVAGREAFWGSDRIVPFLRSAQATLERAVRPAMETARA